MIFILLQAHIDLENVVRKEPGNEEATGLYSMINVLREQVEEVHDLFNWNNFEPAIEALGGVLEHIPWDPTLRELRADCYLGLGNIIHAISDLRSVAKLTTDNTAVYFKLASLHYQLGEAEESLNEIRECLKLDPEHKDCYPMYKKVKKVAKFLVGAKEAREGEDWESCVSNAQKALKNEPKVNRTFIRNAGFHQGYVFSGGVSPVSRLRQTMSVSDDDRGYWRIEEVLHRSNQD